MMDDPEFDDLVHDPLLRRLTAWWIPAGFYDLPAEERRWRGRAFLIAVTMTGGASGSAVMLAWNMALSTDPESEADNRRLVDSVPDEAILAGLEAMREA